MVFDLIKHGAVFCRRFLRIVLRIRPVCILIRVLYVIRIGISHEDFTGLQNVDLSYCLFVVIGFPYIDIIQISV